MKKSIVALAVMASLATPAAAFAEARVYGNIHLSVNKANSDAPGATNNNPTLSSNTSSIGIKGSEDLSHGLKAIYKLEFEVGLADPATTDPGNIPNTGSGQLTGLDQFVGLHSVLGLVKLGTMSTNYKQTGIKVDPLYRTPLEGRGFLGIQSDLHSRDRGINTGRQTNTIQYVSPEFGGAWLVANTSLSGSNSESSGVGIRWASKTVLAYADWIKSQTGDTTNKGIAVNDCNTSTNCSTQSAYKVGARYRVKTFALAIQYEEAGSRTGANYLFTSGRYSINSNNQFVVTYGRASKDSSSGVTSVNSHSGYALAYNHRLSKLTNVYVGYGARSSNVANDSPSMFTAGFHKKF